MLVVNASVKCRHIVSNVQLVTNFIATVVITMFMLLQVK